MKSPSTGESGICLARLECDRFTTALSRVRVENGIYTREGRRD
jgi:hypothetical protein